MAAVAPPPTTTTPVASTSTPPPTSSCSSTPAAPPATAVPIAWTEGDAWADAPLLARGAEATVRAITYLGRPAVFKARTPKAYRHPALDEALTTRRSIAEVRSLVRARRAGVAVPAVYFVRGAAVVMERVGGVSLRTFLRRLADDVGGGGGGARAADDAAAAAAVVGTHLGEAVARLHRAGIVHGDLTPANVMVIAAAREGAATPTAAQADGPAATAVHDGGGAVAPPPASALGPPPPSPRVVLIDFGLSTASTLDEDKAVDLYVLERAVVSGHPPATAAAVNGALFRAYKRGGGASGGVLRRLEEVRLRGRKRVMVG